MARGFFLELAVQPGGEIFYQQTGHGNLVTIKTVGEDSSYVPAHQAVISRASPLLQNQCLSYKDAVTFPCKGMPRSLRGL